MPKRIQLMLDSGAFSAWLRDSQISIDEYASFIKRNKELIHSYVNMDVIPGSKGRFVRTPETVEKSARMSYENLQRIKDKGLSPIPVFHQGESFDWLGRLIDDKEDYIGISPYLRSTPSEVHRWMDHCFEVLAKRRGKKLIKTHGFGVTSVNAILRYPWTTVDSTSWSISAGFGTVYIPSFGNGKLDFTRPTPMRFSTQIVKTKARSSYGMLGLTDQLRQQIDNYVRNQLGLPIESACNSPYSRMDLNIIYFQGLQEHIRKVRKTNQFDIVFASIIEFNPLNIVLTRRNANFRLLSYFKLRNTKQDRFERYVRDGFTTPKKKQACNWDTKSYTLRRTQDFIDRMKESSCAE
jgi:hypothetical protein